MPWRLKAVIVAFSVATGLALAARLLVLENYRITSDSMMPTLADGDLAVVTKFTFNVHLPFSSYEIFRVRQPRPGEVVMFALPDHGLDTFVKRVVAVEGDRVQILDGILQVNGKPASYQVQNAGEALYLETLPGFMPFSIHWDGKRIANYGPVDVPIGYFFALGDNRLDPSDSRQWGPIPDACLKGKISLAMHGAHSNHLVYLGSW